MGNKTSSVLKVLHLHQETLRENNSVKRNTRSIYRMEWPFSAVLPKPLNVGDSIEIEFRIADDTDIFTVNLVCDYESGNKPHNVAYHHKIMFDEQKTILNSKVEGSWRDEIHNMEMHVSPGEHVKMLLMMKDRNTITAYFNDVPHSDYESEINIEEVRYLQIWHGLDKIHSMKIQFAD